MSDPPTIVMLPHQAVDSSIETPCFEPVGNEQKLLFDWTSVPLSLPNLKTMFEIDTGRMNDRVDGKSNHAGRPRYAFLGALDHYDGAPGRAHSCR